MSLRVSLAHAGSICRFHLAPERRGGGGASSARPPASLARRLGDGHRAMGSAEQDGDSGLGESEGAGLDQAEIWVDVNWWGGGYLGSRCSGLVRKYVEQDAGRDVGRDAGLQRKGCEEGCKEKCRLARGMLGKDAGRDAGFPGQGCWERSRVGCRLAQAARLQQGCSHYPIPRGLTEMQNVGSTAEKEKA